MMDSQSSNEEKLRIGVESGSVENYVGLLRTQGNVDIKDSNGQTLLQLAVSLGKQKWVERLLGYGADPLSKDSRGVSVLEVAKGMWAKYPKDNSRNAILKLLLVVIQRDNSRLASCTEARSPHCVQSYGDRESEPKFDSNAAARSSVGVQTFRDVQNDSRPGSSTEPRSSVSVQASGDVQNPANLNEDQVTQLIEGISTLRTALYEGLESICEETAKLKSDLSSRDVILEKLESSVTELAGAILDDKSKGKGTILVRDKSSDGNNIPEHIDRTARDDCIKTLMERTQILNEDDVKTARTRQFYEKMYDGGKFSSTILRFIQSQDQVRVFIDLDCDSIERFKDQFRDHDRERRNGCEYRSFANFQQLQVYFGAAPEYFPMQVPFFKEEKDITHHLAMPLAQLAIYLLFRNDGRPYSDEHCVAEELFGKCIQDAGEMSKRKNTPLFEWLSRGFNDKGRLAKEIELIALPVGISARFNFSTAVNTLCRNLPSLLAFYENFVHQKLVDKLNHGNNVV